MTVDVALESARRISASRIGPFLSIVIPRECVRTMVDPIRRGARPPSTTASMPSPKRRRTIAELMQGGCPVIFALVPVRSPPHFRTSCSVVSFLGHLRAIVLRPLVNSLGKCTFSLTTIVNGPGQNVDASVLAFSSITAIRCASLREETRIGIGLTRLPFTENSLLSACGFLGSHPRPYTVSVGKAMSPPRFTIAAALLMSRGAVVRTFNFVHACATDNT